MDIDKIPIIRHKGYTATQNKRNYRIRIYNDNNELFYTYKVTKRVSEQELIDLIDDLIDYRNKNMWK